MITSKYKILFVLAFAAMVAGCKKYEPVPAEQRTIDYVFNNADSLGTNAYAFLNSVYANLVSGHNRVGGDYLDVATDDAVSANPLITTDINMLALGSFNSTNLPGSENVWQKYYAAIRSANIFITNIGVVPVKDQLRPGLSMKYAWKSEARFLRAFFYFELLKRYGGVPIVGDKVFSIDDNINLPRNSFNDCVNYIVKECDAIKDSMLTVPLVSPTANSQRATNAAALTLKAKVLLYAASPLYNDPAADNHTPLGAADASTKGLVGYSNYDVSRWATAAAAANAVIQLNAFSLVSDFRRAFITQVPVNTEVIFERPNNNTNTVEINNGPVGFPAPLGNGRTNPSQNLVDAFPMKNGLPITATGSGYSAANPYANRDPRLTYTVFYNTSPWLGSVVFTYEGGRSKPNNGTTQTLTGYYMRKFMGLWESASNYGTGPEDWMYFRYADVLLSYAEAQNEAVGPDASVYSAVEKVRQRAGLNPYQLPTGISKDSVRTLIQNERRIEMAFEEDRYFDIRRWKTAEKIMNQPVRGVTIVNNGANYSYTYGNVFSPKFKAPAMYLYPIPYNETLKNPNLKQNPGW